MKGVSRRERLREEPPDREEREALPARDRVARDDQRSPHGRVLFLGPCLFLSTSLRARDIPAGPGRGTPGPVSLTGHFPAFCETNVATSWASWPWNRFSGMTSGPSLIALSTRCLSGFRSSRFGPTCPLVPAALSVWQLPHVPVKSSLPWSASAVAPPLPVVAGACCSVVVPAPPPPVSSSS